jgi:hypothetical protein
LWAAAVQASLDVPETELEREQRLLTTPATEGIPEATPELDINSAETGQATAPSHTTSPPGPSSEASQLEALAAPDREVSPAAVADADVDAEANADGQAPNASLVPYYDSDSGSDSDPPGDPAAGNPSETLAAPNSDRPSPDYGHARATRGAPGPS